MLNQVSKFLDNLFMMSGYQVCLCAHQYTHRNHIRGAGGGSPVQCRSILLGQFQVIIINWEHLQSKKWVPGLYLNWVV